MKRKPRTQALPPVASRMANRKGLQVVWVSRYGLFLRTKGKWHKNHWSSRTQRIILSKCAIKKPSVSKKNPWADSNLGEWAPCKLKMALSTTKPTLLADIPFLWKTTAPFWSHLGWKGRQYLKFLPIHVLYPIQIISHDLYRKLFIHTLPPPFLMTPN